MKTYREKSFKDKSYKNLEIKKITPTDFNKDYILKNYKKKLVLIIEYDIYMFKTLQNILLVEGFDIISASNGLKGIQMIFKLLPDIILCDIKINKRINGYDILKITKSSPVTKKIPFILLSGKVSLKEEEHAINEGVDVFLKKPFENNELLKILNDLGNKNNKPKYKY